MTAPQVSPAPASSGGAFRVLIVEDEEAIAKPLRRALEREGYLVALAATAAEALELAGSWGPDVVLLDLMLPDGNGRDVATSIRGVSAVPIIMVTALDQESDVIAGLEAGADDYIAKPFSTPELLARIRSVSRRASGAIHQPVGTLQVGELALDTSLGTASVSGAAVDLSAKELELLRLLMLRPGVVVRRDELVRAVWGASLSDATKTLDVHMSWLRRKLGDDPKQPRFIETIRGVGFRLIAP